MKWLIISGSLIFVAIVTVLILLEQRDKKQKQIYRVSIKNGKVEPFKDHF